MITSLFLLKAYKVNMKTTISPSYTDQQVQKICQQTETDTYWHTESQDEILT